MDDKSKMMLAVAIAENFTGGNGVSIKFFLALRPYRPQKLIEEFCKIVEKSEWASGQRWWHARRLRMIACPAARRSRSSLSGRLQKPTAQPLAARRGAYAPREPPKSK